MVSRRFAVTVVVYLVFDAIASALNSDRGQSGVLVAAVVLTLLFAAERLVFATPVRQAAGELGLGRPSSRGLIAATLVATALAGILAALSLVDGIDFSPFPGWMWLLPGLFAQGGVAEETLFRGFLFGGLRKDRTFLRAATLSLVPFVAAHLILFARMPWPIALAAVVLAAVMTYPFAYLYEIGGGTIWAPAILHFVAQSALKIVTVSGESAQAVPLVWMAACAIVPYGVFLFRSRSSASSAAMTSSLPAPGR